MSTAKERYCAYCAASLGVLTRGEWEPGDCCGERECQRYAREAAQQEREEAHDQLDRDRGWSLA